jgi:tetratricopeptide (TPR) repeat protein
MPIQRSHSQGTDFLLNFLTPDRYFYREASCSLLKTARIQFHPINGQMKRLTAIFALTAVALGLFGIACTATSSEQYFTDGLAMHRAGKLREAVVLYSKAIESDNRLVMAYQMRAAAWQKMRQYQKAISDYTMCIDLGEPQFKAVGYYNRGVVKNMSGRYAEAIPDFTQAISIDRKIAAAFFHRGVARLKTGDSVGALEDLIQAAKLGDPDAARWLDTSVPDWRQMK